MGHKSSSPEVGHGRVKGADHGQDQRINTVQIIGVMDYRAVLFKPLEAFLHGVKIAHAVID